MRKQGRRHRKKAGKTQHVVQQAVHGGLTSEAGLQQIVRQLHGVVHPSCRLEYTTVWFAVETGCPAAAVQFKQDLFFTVCTIPNGKRDIFCTAFRKTQIESRNSRASNLQRKPLRLTEPGTRSSHGENFWNFANFSDCSTFLCIPTVWKYAAVVLELPSSDTRSISIESGDFLGPQ